MALQTPYTNEQMLRLLALAHRHSNPNLLDNWYFADPINQRGQTLYTGNGYTIDRWNINSDNSAVSEVVDGGVKLSFKAIYGRWSQFIENYLDCAGKTVTLSALFTSVSAPVYLQISDGNGTLSKVITEPGLYTATQKVSASPQKLEVMVQRRDASTTEAVESCVVAAMKLEYGPTQTLAYQDDTGAWQLIDPPPNKQQELAKCQRYFVKLADTNYIGAVGMSWSTAANSAFVSIPIPVPMRSLPSLTSYNVFLASANGTKFTVNSLDVLDMSPVGIRVRVTRTAAFAEGDQISCMLSNVALSAEL